MKNIIQRKLPLDTVYTLTDKKYVSLVDGCGCTCDNCGKLIANMATINDGQRSYVIGFDCLDTILMNNQILSETDIADYHTYKVALGKIMKFIKTVKEVTRDCKTVTGIKFELPAYDSDWHTFYWLHNGNTVSRDNSNVKIKGVTVQLIYKVISDHFKNLTILIND